MKEKIALIARGLTLNGVRSFIESVVAKENDAPKSNETFFLFTDEEKYQKRFKNIKVIYIKKSNKLFWDYLALPYYLYKYQIKEAIYTKNIIPFTHFIFSWKKTIYVLDLAFKYPKLKAYRFWDSLYMNLFLGISVKNSDKILAISKFTRDEIVKFYPFVNKNKISVNYLPINPIFRKIENKKDIQSLINKYKLELPFIFYCGSISPRKNILNLLKAFGIVKNDLPHNLYLLSSRNWNSGEVFTYLNQQADEKVKIINNVSDEELAIFYSIADLFVYPSIYEGFGLPIKEAEACRCKVLTSNFGAMKEISGKETFLVDSANAKEMASKIKKIVK